MCTSTMQSNYARGYRRTPRTMVRGTLLLAAALLALPAWRAPAAAQDSMAVGVAQPRAIAVAHDLAVVQVQDTVPVIRCCVQPPAGLTFWAPLDGSYATLVSGLTGTPSGAVSWVNPPSGHTGSALSLQASGRVDYPASPATSLGTGNFTVDAWIRVPPGQPGVNPLLDNRLHVGPGGLTGFQLFVYNGQIGFQMADGPWSNYVAPTIVADNRWHFVAVTVVRGSSTGGRIYVDGTSLPVYTFNPMGRPGSLGTSNRLAIGHDLNNNSQGMPFEIDEVEIFRRALTQAEVVALFRYPKCRPTARP
jgi:hypothetical protein